VGGLRVLLDEFATILRIAGRKGRVVDDVKRLLIFHPATGQDVRRSGRKALEASGEERRHSGYERRKKRDQSRTARVDDRTL
jgi:hypothetical protein